MASVFEVKLKGSGQVMRAPRIMGLQMMDFGVGSVTLVLEGGTRKRRIPVPDIEYIDEIVDTGGNLERKPVEANVEEEEPSTS